MIGEDDASDEDVGSDSETDPETVTEGSTKKSGNEILSGVPVEAVAAVGVLIVIALAAGVAALLVVRKRK
jgi:hypothetical protein